MKLLNTLRTIKKNLTRYNPSIEVLISQANLVGNLKAYSRALPHMEFAPVLKSNAYGHGIVPVAQILDRQKMAFMALDSLYEAMLLRNEGIRSPFLVIGYTPIENILACRLDNVAFTITSLEQLELLAGAAKRRIAIHLKLDTGMHRQGVMMNQLDAAIKLLAGSDKLIMEGLCSHFADADNDDGQFTRQQVVNWNQAVAKLRPLFPALRYFHISATAGSPYADQAAGNVVRLGLGLYGINPAPNMAISLKPVLEMRSIVSSVKSLGPGEGVGYNLTYETAEPILAATVPVGYFEGVDRRLSNIGFFKLADQCCPIIGRVSMNITSIDATRVPGVRLGDKVTVISSNAADCNSVENIAKFAKTIPYEILVHIPQHLRRVVV